MKAARIKRLYILYDSTDMTLWKSLNYRAGE